VPHKRADVCGAEGDGAPERGEEGAGEHFGGVGLQAAVLVCDGGGRSRDAGIWCWSCGNCAKTLRSCGGS
jgi:hypothetical protein